MICTAMVWWLLLFCSTITHDMYCNGVAADTKDNRHLVKSEDLGLPVETPGAMQLTIQYNNTDHVVKTELTFPHL